MRPLTMKGVHPIFFFLGAKSGPALFFKARSLWSMRMTGIFYFNVRMSWMLFTLFGVGRCFKNEMSGSASLDLWACVTENWKQVFSQLMSARWKLSWTKWHPKTKKRDCSFKAVDEREDCHRTKRPTSVSKRRKGQPFPWSSNLTWPSPMIE